MAEAAVDNLRFYCHLCNKRFQSASSSFTCPFCSNGFIEEVSDQTEMGNSQEETDNDGWDVSDQIRDIFLPGFEEPRSSRSSSSRNRSGHGRMNIENFIHDVIINLGVGVNWANAGNMQVFLGNPGDYAWGREGLDTIITQLLNQMDSTGPPPLAKHMIDSLPTVQIEQDQVKKKLQCSVCWEDFILNEDVKQLPCTHVYHQGCITPWLELHGTCPICRQNLGTNEQTSDNTSAADQSGEGNDSFDLFDDSIDIVYASPVRRTPFNE